MKDAENDQKFNLNWDPYLFHDTFTWLTYFSMTFWWGKCLRHDLAKVQMGKSQKQQQ